MPSVKAATLKQVTYKYKNSDSYAVKNVSFEIEEGDFLLLVGYSGSGKSTLLKTINGLIPNFYAGTFGGSIKLFGEDIADISPAKLANKVGFVFQNPENQLSNLTIEKEIAFPLENFGLPREEIIQRIDEIISMIGIEHIRYKSPFLISGGEQQLTAIAAALALNPKILILDEVTAHISPKSSQIILSKIYELNTKYQKTIILSEHRLDRCIFYANKMAYLENGELKIIDSVENVLRSELYPKEMHPKIPGLYLKLAQETDNFKEIPNNRRNTLENSNVPLTVEDFVKLFKGENGL